MAELNTEYMGLKLRNPIIAGSSGLTENKKHILELIGHGAGAIVLKSLFEEEIIKEMETSLKKIASNQFIYPETLEYYEHYDEKEESPSIYLNLIKELKQETKTPIIASINCVTAEHWTSFPKRIEDAGADALELNMFVMPADLNRSHQTNEKVYFDIIEQVCSQIEIPVALKISPYFSNLGQMIKNLSETKIKGLVLFNKFYEPDIDIEKLELTHANVLSNPDNIHNTLRWIGIMSNHVSCDLAASSGIHDANGAIKQILAGAQAVQIVSTLYKNGAQYMKLIIEEIEKWMDQKGFDNINAFRGKLSQKEIKNPASYERMQFMRQFGEYKQ